jgi:hypothetical protein
MNRCQVCHFETVPDDIAVEAPNGLVVCLVCYGHLTETRLPMPKELRREVEACLQELVV